jgi:hypothetical protein
MNNRKFEYKSIRDTFLHEILMRANEETGWELISIIQERAGFYIGVFKKRVQ